MKELANHELDERLQKQILQAREALKKGGVDYVVQVCGELLKNNPSAYEVRALLCETLSALDRSNSSTVGWLKNKSSGVQFKVSTRSLLKNNPLELVHRCDEALRKKQALPEVFLALEKAGYALGWLETQVLACQAVVELEPEKSAPRLALARILVEAKRPQQAIDHLEWVLAKEPANGEAQTLLKNASVAETLQRGNWEDTETTFHTKAKDA
ncbi:MAG: tetratricopeptide repeat protein [Verrucomicrobia bacterium]|nr:tetratricopeptide repeat protein [Verrucomicrobiota bacterium]